MMKNLVTVFAILSLAATTAFASNTPEKMVVEGEENNIVNIIENIISVSHLDIFTTAEYEVATENLSFTTESQISAIQIFDADGNLKFSLPVMSKDVKINRNLFSSGEYTLGFMLIGDSHLHTTKVSIK